MNNISQIEYVINPFSAGTAFLRQILTSKYDPRAERIKIFIMGADP